jgi:hypothetical protein
VEVAVISEAEKIELEALALHHAYIRNVADANFCKIRLSRDRAETSELWTVKAYPVIVVGVFVDKRFQHLWSIVALVFGLTPQRVQTFVFSI